MRRSPEPQIFSTCTTAIPSSGHTLRFQDDDITVTFPDGFISQSCLSFEHAVTSPEFFDPHSFPEGVRPVSAILYLHPLEQEGDFLQPIEVTLPHFINVEKTLRSWLFSKLFLKQCMRRILSIFFCPPEYVVGGVCILVANVHANSTSQLK